MGFEVAQQGPAGSELRAQPLAANPADDQALLGAAQQSLCPVYRTTINELQPPAG